MSSALTTGMESYKQMYSSRPSRGVTGMLCLIVAESAVFVIFVVAYVFYLGKSLSGPLPGDVLTLPIAATVCLLSSSVTVHLGSGALHRGEASRATLWIGLTALLGVIFLVFTGYEWFDLIVHKHLTIATNLFGTTFYSLVGLHATHVIVGLFMLTLVTWSGATGRLNKTHAEKVEVVSYYWHFVDAVWVVVFTVVYVLGR